MRIRAIIITVAALALSSCGAPEREKPAAGPKIAPTVLTDANFEKEVLQSKLPVLVDFWATWCPPCVQLSPIVEELASDHAGKLKVCKLDVDEAKAMADRYEIRSIPQLFLFKDGKVVSQREGLPPGDIKAALSMWLNEHIQ